LIEIKKGKEPSELAKYRNLPDATYDNMHGAPSGKKDKDGNKIDVYSIVLNSLIKEQGQLCAYCMKRIPERKGKPFATIEHIVPQSGSDESKRLDYRNMLAVCSGNRNGSDEEKTCDARRGILPKDRQVLYVNPLEKESLKTIVYDSKGIISSSDSDINNNLNDTLNLNCSFVGLPDLRKVALITLQQEINERYPGKTVPKEYLLKLLVKFENERTSKRPYVGILIQWLKKKIG
jgi:uncharacterized protein (TIGR02646 family)